MVVVELHRMRRGHEASVLFAPVGQVGENGAVAGEPAVDLPGQRNDETGVMAAQLAS
jgi:hypothetical protein